MKITMPQSPQKYIAHIKSRLDSPLSLGRERFTGVCLGPFFSVNYYSGEEFGRRCYPIMNKAIGVVRNIEGKAEVSFYIFRGLTAPPSLIGIFLLSLLIFEIVKAPGAIYFALGWTVAVTLSTFLCTSFSEIGQYGTAKLKQFLSPSKTDKKP